MILLCEIELTKFAWFKNKLNFEEKNLYLVSELRFENWFDQFCKVVSPAFRYCKTGLYKSSWDVKTGLVRPIRPIFPNEILHLSGLNAEIWKLVLPVFGTGQTNFQRFENWINYSMLANFAKRIIALSGLSAEIW